MKYTKLEGVILKKQNYREADQIVTLWTRETGKVRVMARGLRLAKSKLAFGMQDLAVVEFETAGNKSLPALIAAKPIKNFMGIRQDLNKTMAAFYAAELVLKTTADEQANIEAYNLLLEFLHFVDGTPMDKPMVLSLVDNFSLRLLAFLGFSIEHASGVVDISSTIQTRLDTMQSQEFADVLKMPLNDQVSAKLHQVVKNFIEYVLERNLKSDKFLMSV